MAAFMTVLTNIGTSRPSKSSQIVMLVWQGPSRLTAWCSCERQRRPGGYCAHLDYVLGQMRPWHRQRTRISLGGNHGANSAAA